MTRGLPKIVHSSPLSVRRFKWPLLRCTSTTCPRIWIYLGSARFHTSVRRTLTVAKLFSVSNCINISVFAPAPLRVAKVSRLSTTVEDTCNGHEHHDSSLSIRGNWFCWSRPSQIPWLKPSATNSYPDTAAASTASFSGWNATTVPDFAVAVMPPLEARPCGAGSGFRMANRVGLLLRLNSPSNASCSLDRTDSLAVINPLHLQRN